MMARFVEKPCQDVTGCGFISVSLQGPHMEQQCDYAGTRRDTFKVMLHWWFLHILAEPLTLWFSQEHSRNVSASVGLLKSKLFFCLTHTTLFTMRLFVITKIRM